MPSSRDVLDSGRIGDIIMAEQKRAKQEGNFPLKWSGSPFVDWESPEPPTFQSREEVGKGENS